MRVLQGTAEVMFARRSDAFQALKRYNNVQLDGKPMKIEIVSSKSEVVVPLAPRVNVVGGVNGQRTVVMMYVSLLFLLLLHIPHMLHILHGTCIDMFYIQSGSLCTIDIHIHMHGWFSIL